VNDAPAAGERAQPDRGMRQQDHPERDHQVASRIGHLGPEGGNGEDHARDDAHGLLGIVRAVIETE